MAPNSTIPFASIIYSLVVLCVGMTLLLLTISQGYCYPQEDQRSLNENETNSEQTNQNKNDSSMAATATKTLPTDSIPSLIAFDSDYQDDEANVHPPYRPDLDSTSTLPTPTTTTTTVTGPFEASTNSPSTADPIQCMGDNNYCLNGGTCQVSGGKMICICPKEFYGDRCETRNICQTIIVDSLTGVQICSKINRECFMNDRFFRCSCYDDEYFVFRTSLPQQQQQKSQQQPAGAWTTRVSSTAAIESQRDIQIENQRSISSTYGRYDSLTAETSESSQTPTAGYLAECRKIDKCLGIRCSQRSEICRKGKCICNQYLGYSKDPIDGLCKLLDLCSIPTSDGTPICGQAQCVATYDHDLYKCICPYGYKAIRVGDYRNSTQCAPLTNKICDIPLLNKCQHLCQVDAMTNSYKCSCLPGYMSGTHQGIDDHLCFFDEHVDEQFNDDNRLDGDKENIYDGTNAGNSPQSSYEKLEYIFKPYTVPKQSSRQSSDKSMSSSASIPLIDKVSNTFTYDPLTTHSSSVKTKTAASEFDPLNELSSDDQMQHVDKITSLSRQTVAYIKREVRSWSGRNINSSINSSSGSTESDSMRPEHRQHYDITVLNKMSAQDRCNMYCEENKICVLENGSTDSYQCVCDRQGYVSVGDRCLNWCTAADFIDTVENLVKATCLSGVCKPTGPKPSNLEGKQTSDLSLKLESESSWRPTFECDCSGSPFLIQDPETRLCKLDFQAILSPCLPGNVGYIDCVENKNAYCSVLHTTKILGLQKEKPIIELSPSVITGGSGGRRSRETNNHIDFRSSSSETGAGSSNNNNKKKVSDQLYACVCSPEKKFLVDKPRGKARCVNECDLLNVECGRFNRVCRVATIAPDDFGQKTLVGIDQATNEARMKFKRTGCECLPGFNVGPSESAYFTLDDNDAIPASNVALSSSSLPASDSSNLVNNKNDHLDDSLEHSRAKYMNINSSCLLDYDVVEFHASFKAPADFDPIWIKIRDSTVAIINGNIPQQQQKWPSSSAVKNLTIANNNQLGQQHLVNKTSLNSLQDNGNGSTDSHMTMNQKQANRTVNSSGDFEIFTSNSCAGIGCVLGVPDFMKLDISELPKEIVLVAQCDPVLLGGLEAYRECIRYRYWIVQKLRQHFVDWRRVMTAHLSGTFDLMEGNVRLRLNKCEATLRSVTSSSSQSNFNGNQTSRKSLPLTTNQQSQQNGVQVPQQHLTSNGILSLATDQQSVIDADVDCVLTLHSASDGSSPRYSRKVLLEKQLQKFIFVNPSLESKFGKNYYLMAPNVLIRRESFDQLNDNRKLFNPCNKTDYEYCDKQTKCDMVDAVNFTCTCDYGYTPIGSRDIYYADSRKEVCEDINECLFDVCKELANVSTCINEIGDYRCQCNRHYTGDNKRYCIHVCNTIPCKHGICKIVDDHHAFCECEKGYTEDDCSVQDPSFALRKANMIICCSIFVSCLLLVITIAINLNSQLKKAKKKLKRLEANEAAYLFELAQQQPFRPRMSKVSSGG